MLDNHGLLTFVAHCDACPATYTTDTDDFREAIAEIKREGWMVTKDKDDEWTHLCSGCKDTQPRYSPISGSKEW